MRHYSLRLSLCLSLTETMFGSLSYMGYVISVQYLNALRPRARMLMSVSHRDTFSLFLWEAQSLICICSMGKQTTRSSTTLHGCEAALCLLCSLMRVRSDESNAC